MVSGIASEKGTRTNIRLAQEREARQRRQSQMQYKDGGGVYLGPNNRFDSGSLTGEYLYPLPQSMEDQANVEVEKGEYVTPRFLGAGNEGYYRRHNHRAGFR